MSNRTLRVNELVQRELSRILHTHYQAEAAAVTITSVDIAPDLHDGRVFFSVIGAPQLVADKGEWLQRIGPSLQHEVARRVVLKYTPKLKFIADHSVARGVAINHLIDTLKPSAPAAPEEE